MSSNSLSALLPEAPHSYAGPSFLVFAFHRGLCSQLVSLGVVPRFSRLIYLLPFALNDPVCHDKSQTILFVWTGMGMGMLGVANYLGKKYPDPRLSKR